MASTDAAPLTIGSTIRLFHPQTAGYLQAIPTVLSSPSGQHPVATSQGNDAETFWVIEPGLGSNALQGSSIGSKAVIRLKHVQSRRRLHSHDTRGVFPSYQEVTAYPQDPDAYPKGDENDNWRVDTADGELWRSGSEVELVHVPTGRFLHSSRELVDSNIPEKKGVACAGASSQNTFWVAQPTSLATGLGGAITMRLKTVHITGFRSIKETVAVHIDRRVTVLIGANDHGKTNILRAVSCLNDKAEFTADDVNYESEGKGHLPLIEWTFDILIDQNRYSGELFNLSEVTFIRSGLSSEVSIKGHTDLPVEIRDLILLSRPRIEIFRAQEKMFDEVTKDELNLESHEFMRGLFIKAGLWENRNSIFQQTFKTKWLLDEASKRLTETLQREWQQGNDLAWQMEHIKDGNAIRIHLKDPANRARYDQISRRSSGFNAFFSLSLAIFARTSQQRASNFVYLFDEPGTYLHPIAQINLQRIFHSLSENHQLMYSTHSIFLVNKNNPRSNHVVRKGSSGTVINAKPYAKNWKAVRESLGILLSHNFLISEYTLMVEGPSDPMFITSCMNKLVQHGKLDIDLNDFSIEDGGDSSNYIAMTKIMLDEGRRVLALVDGDDHGDDTVDRLKKICPMFLESSHLQIHKLPQLHSIEDLLPVRELYVEAACETLSELLELGVVKTKDDVSTQEAVSTLRNALVSKAAKEKTLGKLTEDTVRSLLENRAKISKVNIAMKYEDKLSTCDIAKVVTSPEFEKFVVILKSALKLHEREAKRDVVDGEGMRALT